MAEMFRVVARRRAWWPVIFPGVTEDGEVIENRFEMRFNILDEEALIAATAEVEKLDAMIVTPGTDYAGIIAARLALVHQLADGWRNIGGEDGRDLSFTDDQLTRVLRLPGVFRAIVLAFERCIRGAREGN